MYVLSVSCRVWLIRLRPAFPWYGSFRNKFLIQVKSKGPKAFTFTFFKGNVNVPMLFNCYTVSN